MRHRTLTGVIFVVVLAASAAAALADPDADRCGGTKEKAAGRYGSKVLNCHATATARGESVDPDCLSRAFVKLTSGFSKAEDVGGCLTSGDASTAGITIDDDVDEVVSALAPDPDDAARLCAASKMKAAGRHYLAILKCYSKGASRSAGPDPDCLSKSDGKLVDAFTTAESVGGCTTMDDAATVAGLDDTGAHERVADLSPVCGDDITGVAQACEAADDGACPGLCTASCTCVNCGDGVAELPEECDDGGNVSGDGCSATCVLEDASALCDGVATTSGTALDAVLVSTDLNQPIHATAPPLDPSRLFVVEREGTIRVVNLANDTVRPTPFLDIADLVGTDGEGGLLSMAFDPDYENNRRFFVNYTNNDGDTTIARYEASASDANVADESAGHVLFVIDQPYSNHNGGQIAFGADGYLYIGMGDGGGGDDPDENGQDDAKILGKMLRVDVNVAGAPYYAIPTSNPHYAGGSGLIESVWAKGMRNPWRFAFDRTSGDLVIADVGQGAREEIDYQSVASMGGENYGWDIFEGDICHEPDPAPMCPAPPTGFTMPILVYDHGEGCAITGGFVYRGCAMPDLAGTYFYSDSCQNFVRTIEIVGGAATNAQNRTADVTSGGVSFGLVASFGEDARGELYIVDLGGALYRIEPE